MKREHLISTVLLIGLWQLVGLAIGNDIILPLPLQVLVHMGQNIIQPNFFIIVGATLQKAFTGFILALLFGVFTGILAGASSTIENFFRPIELVLKTIPNISYMFLLLLWFPSEKAVGFVIFFICMPVFYANVMGGMKAMDQDLQDVLLLYGETKRLILTKVYLPQIYPYLKSAVYATLSLSIKVGVMAEVLGQVRFGVGKEMYLGKLNLDMVGVFGWTIWIIVIVAGLERLCQWLFACLDRRIG